ncbi:DUF1837 domain-containing protein [Sinorhizobium meliloti]|uniref:HamA C-terminal domain-containing protein n=1 Tax=Rhizobium meliloti TaxID=382 RepID=UPI000B4A105D|nr:DUF1837 domain-containing protein [Sinorhizobium meliloti]ASP56571.1 DUF1837 domain-containing protein [Sinorhizobium meliloti]MDW9396319.1 DUF1837 domain-containing protein [Sinorhizobium meliloti]MDX0367552.1 DUF1837 domain-containing protein [Sinorhizobium meliloti]RVL58804.1 DUF1837 domain-containing protein [Sinorhizobium meliloti]
MDRRIILWIILVTAADNSLSEALATLLNPSNVEDFIQCAVQLAWDPEALPPTSLLYPSFNEDIPKTADLAEYLWRQCFYYALPRRKQAKLAEDMRADPSRSLDANRIIRSFFMDFSAKNPARSSEVGEVIAYSVVQHYLRAPQIAAKMALKTSANMPVHGLDGIHAAFENGAMTIFFLEAKLAKSASAGARSYAESAKDFLGNRAQYLREYDIVADLGNLDALEGEDRKAALDYFDIIGHPRLQRRERYVGVVCYSEKEAYSKKIAVGSGSIDAHEAHFAENLAKLHERYRQSALRHIEANGGDPAKCYLFFLAVPDINELRRKFYQAMGLEPPRDLPEGDDETVDSMEQA